MNILERLADHARERVEAAKAACPIEVVRREAQALGVPVIAVGAKPGQTRQLFRLNTAKAVSAELASRVWGEEAQFSVSTAGWVAQTDENGVVTNPDPLAGFIEDVLRKNAFGEKLQELKDRFHIQIESIGMK